MHPVSTPSPLHPSPSGRRTPAPEALAGARQPLLASCLQTAPLHAANQLPQREKLRVACSPGAHGFPGAAGHPQGGGRRGRGAWRWVGSRKERETSPHPPHPEAGGDWLWGAPDASLPSTCCQTCCSALCKILSNSIGQPVQDTLVVSCQVPRLASSLKH